MSISIKMPALSPTMEEGTLAKWLVKEGDTVASGDIMAEIETDKATMEFEAVDEGVIAAILIEEGTEGVGVGTVIAVLAEDGESVDAAVSDAGKPADRRESNISTDSETEQRDEETVANAAKSKAEAPSASQLSDRQTTEHTGARVKASPLARRLAEKNGVDLTSLTGSGPNGRIIKADIIEADIIKTDIENANTPAVSAAAADTVRAKAVDPSSHPAAAASNDLPDFGIPHSDEKLNNVRKVIARRLTEAKQTIPHIYLTVDVRLDALLALRSELNAALEKQEIKLSVNDLVIKALAKALQQVPQCNVSFGGDILRQFERQDISVAVAAPSGLITPIIVDAGAKAVSAISGEMKNLAAKARDGKLQPNEYQGGTASLSNLGMFGTKQFDAVINPPQAMILAIGAGEQRPVVMNGELSVATIMTATGSFDHRAIDGVDGARLMEAFKNLIEQPLGLVA